MDMENSTVSAGGAYPSVPASEVPLAAGAVCAAVVALSVSGVVFAVLSDLPQPALMPAAKTAAPNTNKSFHIPSPFHSLTDPMVIPCTKYPCTKGYTIKIGMIATTMVVILIPLADKLIN